MQYLKFLFLGVVALTAIPAFAMGRLPSTQPIAESTPATQPSGNSVDLRDYCTVLLATKLQDHLAATDEQRSAFADMKTKLYAYLDNAAGNFAGTNITPGLIAARAEVVLNKIGTMVHDELTPNQRGTLETMFDDHTLQPIRVSAAVEQNAGYRGISIQSGVHLEYTHFGETPRTAQNNAVVPTSQPIDAQAETPHPRILPVPPQDGIHIDVPGAIEGLQSTSIPRQAVAASNLVRATPDDKLRPDVLAALRPYVKDSSNPRWPTFVTAFCVWADQTEIETVKSILNSSDSAKGFNQQEQSSAAACTALLRLDSKTAVDAINARIDNQLFRTHLLSDVHRLATIDGPAKQIAQSVFNQLMYYRQGVRITAEQ
jgi:hypothetical protein